MKPWVKVWRPRPGSRFEAVVSPMAKVFFKGLLSYADDNGEIHLDASGKPHQALGKLLGVPPRERRPLERYLSEWEAHGCATIWEGEGVRTITLRTPDEHRTNAGRTQDRPRTDACGEHVATMSRDSLAPNPPKSHTPKIQEREEKRRKDQTRTRARGGEIRSLLIRGYQERYEREARDAWVSIAANEREIGQVVAYHAARESTPGDIAKWLDAAFANPWGRSNRWPWRWLAKDPARFFGGEILTAEEEAAREAQRRDRARMAEAHRRRDEWERRMAPSESDLAAVGDIALGELVDLFPLPGEGTNG